MLTTYTSLDPEEVAASHCDHSTFVGQSKLNGMDSGLLRASPGIKILSVLTIYRSPDPEEVVVSHCDQSTLEGNRGWMTMYSGLLRASPGIEIASVLTGNSQRRRRSRSTASVNCGNVHDRAFRYRQRRSPNAISP